MIVPRDGATPWGSGIGPINLFVTFYCVSNACAYVTFEVCVNGAFEPPLCIDFGERAAGEAVIVQPADDIESDMC